MRFALAGFNHETNTFHSIPTEYENFEKSVMLRGEEITKLYETPSSVGGFYQASRDLGFEIVPLMFAQTGPLGTITSDAFERILGEIFREPDQHLGYILNYFSVGTILSLITLLAGCIIIFQIKKNEQNL